MLYKTDFLPTGSSFWICTAKKTSQAVQSHISSNTRRGKIIPKGSISYATTNSFAQLSNYIHLIGLPEQNYHLRGP